MAVSLWLVEFGYFGANWSIVMCPTGTFVVFESVKPVNLDKTTSQLRVKVRTRGIWGKLSLLISTHT